MDDLLWMFDADLGDDELWLYAHDSSALQNDNNSGISDSGAGDAAVWRLILESEFIDDDAAECLLVADSRPVASTAVTATAQPDDAWFWNWDDDADDELGSDNVQLLDYVAKVAPAADEWPWDEDLDDEVPVDDFAQAVQTVAPPEDGWCHEDDPDDDWLAFEDRYAAFTAYTDARQSDEWLWDDDVEDEWSVDDVQSTTTSAQPPEADWDWTEDVEDEWSDLLDDTDDAVGSDNNPVLAIDDGYQWDELAEDDWQDDSQPVAASAFVSTLVNAEDAWPHLDEFAEDDWQDEAAPVPTIVYPATYDDLWDWDEAADDEQATDEAQAQQTAAQGDDGWFWDGDEFAEDDWQDEAAPVVPSVVPPPAQPADDAWDWQEDTDDGWAEESTSVPDAQAPVPDDAWPWCLDDDVDDDLPADQHAVVSLVPNPFLCAPDAWDWHADDVEDEPFAGLLDPAPQRVLPTPFSVSVVVTARGAAWLPTQRRADAVLPARPPAAILAGRPNNIILPVRAVAWLAQETMTQILEKRTAEVITYDVRCSALLAAGETITGVTSVTSDSTGLVFGTPVVLGSPKTYPDGLTDPASTVIQVQISGGTIAGGVPYVDYVVRVQFTTTVTGNSRQATVKLRLKDAP
jgi:hypothetical protein